MVYDKGIVVYPNGVGGGGGGCPCPYPSHFNTTDGTTNGDVSSVPTYNRYISTPGLFNTGGWDDGNTHPTTHSNSVSYNTPEPVRFETQDTDFIVTVYDADGSTILEQTQVVDINADTTVSNGGVTVQISSFTTSSDQWEAMVSISVSLSTIIPNSGRVTVLMEHINPSGTYSKQQEFFYDSTSHTATLSGVTITENTASRIINFLSGVQFYSLGSPFVVDIADIDYLNSESYPFTQVQVRGSDFGLPQLNLRGSDLNGWTNDWDDVDDTYHNDSWSITSANFCHEGDASCNANTVDWSNGSIVDSNHQNILVNTWSQQSDELSEFFRDEVFRQTSTYGSWDSTQNLTTYDHQNHAQVICGRVQVPDTDYSGYNPLSNPDYSSYNGNEYYRTFTDVNNNTRTTAYLTIAGFTVDDLINNRIELWFFIPGKWASECFAHGTDVYNFSTFNGDNDPIRVSDSTSGVVHISFGTLGLDSSNNELRMRMVINDPSIKPAQILVGW